MSKPRKRVWLSRAVKAGWARVKAGEGFIYIAEIRPDLIKIGHALDPYRRLVQIGMSPTRRLLATMRAPREAEIALHKTLHDFRLPEHGSEFYPRSILNHPAIPAELRAAA
jgi:hypothetical protein